MVGGPRRLFIMNAGGLGVVCLFNASFLIAQSQFEVASIKPSLLNNMDREGNRRETVDTTPGTVTMRNISLKSCVRWAYGVQASQVSGSGWAETERFDIVAKAPGQASEDQLKVMMQALLVDRFKLMLHRESKTMTAYTLAVAKSGPKLPASDGDGKSKHYGNGVKETFEKTSLAELAESLSVVLRAPVVDRTELKGRFDFAMDFSGFFVPGATLDDLPGFVNNSIQSQLGLKLESRKAPVEILMIDHAERVPSENE
jgi:uncharacterized protein (TIGR03435 family)